MTSLATRWTISTWRSSSFLKPTSGIMISGFTLMPFLLHFGGGFEDGAGLHLGDFRIDDAETAAAEAEHRVELVQFARRAA